MEPRKVIDHVVISFPNTPYRGREICHFGFSFFWKLCLSDLEYKKKKKSIDSFVKYFLSPNYVSGTGK